MHRRLRPALSLAFAAALALTAAPALACEPGDVPAPPAHDHGSTCESTHSWSGGAHHRHSRHAHWHWRHRDCDGGTSENPPVEQEPPAEDPSHETPSPQPTPEPTPPPEQPGDEGPSPEPTPPAPEPDQPTTDTDGPAEPADAPEAPTETPDTETVVLANPATPGEPERLAETGIDTSLAIPCMIAAITAGAGVLVARRRAMAL